MLLLPLTYKNPCHCWLTRVCCHTLTKPDYDYLAPLQNSTLRTSRLPLTIGTRKDSLCKYFLQNCCCHAASAQFVDQLRSNSMRLFLVEVPFTNPGSLERFWHTSLATSFVRWQTKISLKGFCGCLFAELSTKKVATTILAGIGTGSENRKWRKWPVPRANSTTSAFWVLT